MHRFSSEPEDQVLQRQDDWKHYGQEEWYVYGVSENENSLYVV